MSELFGNSEQVSEQFGNSEQLLYTPTTEEALKSWLHDGKTSAEFHRWLAEVKAQAWQEGYGQGCADNYGDYRDAESANNPYRQGEEQ